MFKPALLTRKQLEKILSMSKSSIYRLLETDPTFPKSRNYGGNMVRWMTVEVEQWLDTKIDLMLT